MRFTLGERNPMPKYLETDEATEVFVTLTALSDFLQRSSNDVYYWKWVFIALHNAVQGAMVVALRRSDGFGPIQEKIERKWHEEYQKTGKSLPIDERLLRFLELYEKIKTPGMLQNATIKCYSPPGGQDRAMTKLNDIRNEFIHFTPKGWSLELTGAPELCLEVVDVIDFLTKHCMGFIITAEISSESYSENLRTITDALHLLKAKYA